MQTLIFDIETNGFLDVLDTIHVLSMKDPDTGKKYIYNDDEKHLPRDGGIGAGIDRLARADRIVGHNIIRFDLPAIEKVYPAWKYTGVVRDSLLLSRLIWPELRNTDVVHMRRGRLKDFPKKFIGKHSLEAWGHRLAEFKVGTEITDWSQWTPLMQERCAQDVEVNEELWRIILLKDYHADAIELEHEFAKIIFLQEEQGFDFDEPAASKLYGMLCHKRDKMGSELIELFPAWHKPVGMFVPKRDNKARGYTAGTPIMKTKLTYFNPASRDHIASRLSIVHGWKPTEFTKKGKPKIDEAVLSQLAYPEAAKLAEYLSVAKTLGMLGEGAVAWLKLVQNGKIYGRVQTVGAVTRRCTHMRPNISQVPTTQKPYGKECRALFMAPKGYVLVGADAISLELRCLGHYMHRYDGGKYAEAVISGDKTLGTDPHSLAATALGLDPTKMYIIKGKHILGRELAKRWVYAFLYGAGDEKLGAMLGKGRGAGKKMRALFLNNIPAMARLKKQLLATIKKTGGLRGVDGGRIHVRSEHSVLSTLLQSAGAIAMKKALVLLYLDLSTRGWVHGEDYAYVANVHDEIQAIVREDKVNDYIEAAVRSIRDAGDALGFRCPLDGSAKAGPNWAETH